MCCLKNSRCVRRILARAKPRSRAFSKVSPSVFLSPFVVELVCSFDFCFGLGNSSSSESPALYEAGDADILGECSSSLRGSAHGAFFKRKKCQKLFRVFLLSFFCFCSRLLFSSSDVFVLSFTRGLRKKICAKKSNNLNSSYIFC